MIGFGRCITLAALLMIAFTVYVVVPYLYVGAQPTDNFLLFRFFADRLDYALLLHCIFCAAFLFALYVVSKVPVRGFGTSFGVFQTPMLGVSVLVSVAANILLAVDGGLQIDLASGRKRDSVLYVLGNVHLLGLLLAIGAKRWRVFFVVSVYTVAIGLLEGRRTAVILPLFIFMLDQVVDGKLRFRRIVVGGFLVFVLFVVATSFRVYGEWSVAIFGLIFEYLVGRVGNPLFILTFIVEYPGFDPKTISVLLEKFVPGLDAPFDTNMGNHLGRYLGLLNSLNYHTGLNPGWVGEAYLLGGWLGVLTAGAGFGTLFGVLWSSAGADVSGRVIRIFLCVILLSGYQMEVPHSLFSAFRIYFAVYASVCLAGALKVVKLQKGPASA